MSGINTLIALKKLVLVSQKSSLAFQVIYIAHSLLLGLSISSRTYQLSVWIICHAKLAQYIESQKHHMFLAKFLHNLSMSDIGMFDYTDVILPKEHSPEEWLIPPEIPCRIS